MSRLLIHYRDKARPALQQSMSLPNPLAVPRIEKLVVNTGVGKLLSQQPKNLEVLQGLTAKITGQKPSIRRAKKAIAGFKTREGQIVGLMVTLRGRRMYDFLDKLINAALPRSRDFRGLSRRGFDGRGNYTLGLREHIIFPEMVQEESPLSFGLQVTIMTNAGDDERAYQLLKTFSFPFKD